MKIVKLNKGHSFPPPPSQVVFLGVRVPLKAKIKTKGGPVEAHLQSNSKTIFQSLNCSSGLLPVPRTASGCCGYNVKY